MKTNCKKMVGWLLGWVAVVSIGFTGCRKDEPKPEIVENPLNREIYYIAGKVTDGTNGIGGVKVTVPEGDVTTADNGTYQLPVTKKGAFDVTFSKTGYVQVTAHVVVAQEAKHSSIISLVQQLTPTAKPVKVEAGKDTTVYDENKPISVLFIPKGAVNEDTEMTVTEYVGGEKGDGSHISISVINCQPDGQKFEKPVEVTVKNATSPIIYFSEVNHYIEKSGRWELLNRASYDKDRNVYVSSLNGFSNHSFGFGCLISDGESVTEDMEKIEIDNLGNMKAKEQAISAKMKMGWTVEGDLKQQIKNSFPVLAASDVEALATQLVHAIATKKGAGMGVTEAACPLGSAKLSGDTKVTVETKARKVTTTISFWLNYQGQNVTFNVTITTYMGILTSITTQYGGSHTDHSGSVIS